MERTEKQIRDNKMGNKSQLWCPNLEMSRRINGVPRAKLHLIKPTYWVHSEHIPSQIEKTQKQRDKNNNKNQTSSQRSEDATAVNITHTEGDIASKNDSLQNLSYLCPQKMASKQQRPCILYFVLGNLNVMYFHVCAFCILNFVFEKVVCG